MQSQVQFTLKQQRLKYLTESLKPVDRKNKRKTFWRFIKSQKQDTTEISLLQTPTDQVTMPKEIAETLNNQFKSVFMRRIQKQSLKLLYPHFHQLMNLSFIQVVFSNSYLN